jgi:uncharacterized protein GlcG (DUF336 family)
MNIAVVDEGGNLIAHVRMDGAWIGSIDISIKKAYTSRAFDITTKDLATHSQSGGQFFGIHASNDGKIMIFAGGIPLKRDGRVVGAIGVSGGSGEQDQAVAEAGAASLTQDRCDKPQSANCFRGVARPATTLQSAFIVWDFERRWKS